MEIGRIYPSIIGSNVLASLQFELLINQTEKHKINAVDFDRFEKN